MEELLEPAALARLHEILDRNDQRRIAGDPRLAVDEVRQLRERCKAVLCPSLRDVAVDPHRLLLARLLLEQLDDLIHVDSRVPHRERAHAREVRHRRAVGAANRTVDRLSLLGVEAAVPAGDGEARYESLQVPLERARQRLVEVVDVEDEPPVGGGVHAEVGEVSVPAELDLQSRPRESREIRRHHGRGAAEERERRNEHAPVPNRDELLHARARLRLEQVDRVAPVRRRRPFAVDRAPDLGPCSLALRSPLGRREVRHDLRLGRPAASWSAGLRCALLR